MTDAGARRGMLVSLEGVDCSGKSTQVVLLEAGLRAAGIEVVTVVPAQTELGAMTASVLLERGPGHPLDPWTEALLFVAARAQLVAEVIEPALRSGAVVVADRFTDSTLAYQGGGRGLDIGLLRRLHDAALGGLWPDITILLDISDELAASRRRRVASADRFEQAPESFHASVRRTYLELAAAEPQRFRVVDAARAVDLVGRDVVDAVRERVRSRSDAAHIATGPGPRR